MWGIQCNTYGIKDRYGIMQIYANIVIIAIIFQFPTKDINQQIFLCGGLHLE